MQRQSGEMGISRPRRAKVRPSGLAARIDALSGKGGSMKIRSYVPLGGLGIEIDSAGPAATFEAAVKPVAARLARRHFRASAPSSTNVDMAAPRDRASSPSVPPPL